MQLTFNVLIIGTLLCFGHAEVVLEKGKNATVEFEGDEMLIRFDNPQQKLVPVELCLGSTAGTDYKYCPPGYTGAILNVKDRQETYRLNRRGQLFTPKGTIVRTGEVVFGVDGTVNVYIADVSNSVTVKLPNAEIPVITTTMATSETAQKKESDKMAIIGIICGVSGFLLLLLIIGCVLLYFCWYKKQHHRIEIVPTDHQTYGDNVDVRESLIAKASVPHQRLRPASTTTTTPKLTSTSATKVSEAVLGQDRFCRTGSDIGHVRSGNVRTCPDMSVVRFGT